MSLFLEKFAPYILAITGALLWWRLKITLPSGDAILSSSLTIGAILTGFLATAKAVLLSLNSPIMDRIRETGYINDLVSYLSQAIWLSFGYCCLAIMGFFVDTSSVFYGITWFALGLGAGGAFIRVVNIMLKILRHPMPKA